MDSSIVKTFSLIIALFCLCHNTFAQIINLKNSVAPTEKVCVLIQVAEYEGTLNECQYRGNFDVNLLKMRNFLFNEISQIVKNEAYLVSNRDMEALDKKVAALSGATLETKTGGYLAAAKEQAADYLLRVEYTQRITATAATPQLLCQWVNTQTGATIPACFVGRATALNLIADAAIIAKTNKTMLDFVRQFVRTQAQHRFAVEKADSTRWLITPTTPFVACHATDHFSFFSSATKQVTIANQSADIQIYKPVSNSKFLEVNKKSIAVTPSLLTEDPTNLLGAQAGIPLLAGTPTTTAVVLPITYEAPNKLQSFYASKIQEAVVLTLGRTSGVKLIEPGALFEPSQQQHQLADFAAIIARKEKAATNAPIILSFSDFVCGEEEVSFSLTLTHARTKATISNLPFKNVPLRELDSKIAKALSEFFITPCQLEKLNNEQMNVYINTSSNLNKGVTLRVSKMQRSKNMQLSTTTQKSDILLLRVVDKQGQLLVCSIVEILDKESFNKMEGLQEENFFFCEDKSKMGFGKLGKGETMRKNLR